MVSQGAVAVWLAAWGYGGTLLAAATLGAVAALAACWVRLRGRWCSEWLSVAAGYASRRRSLDAGVDPATLLEWMSPGARVVGMRCDGDPAGVIEDSHGLAALLELGHPSALLPAAAAPLPVLSSLLAPGTRMRLVVTGVPPAANADLPAISYRQLTRGRLLSQQRVVLAVQAVRADGIDSEALQRILTSAVRRVRRRLQARIGVRLLSEAAVHAVLADLAHHEPAQPAREAWRWVRVGGLAQATYRLDGWPEADLSELVPHLLVLPATATTVGLTVAPGPTVALAVRLAAPDPGALALAGQALRRLLERHGAAADRLDGCHGPALAATLPAGGDAALVRGFDRDGAVAPALGGAGLVLGVDRHGEPVTARFFRAEPTRALLVGGVRAAQLVTLRALALGARVVVESGRPQAWEPFARAVSAPGTPVAVVPPGRLTSAPGAPGTALHPQLVVVDTGPLVGDVPTGTVPWRTALVVRDELAAADVDLLERCDLLMLQPLTAAEAALVTGSLGLNTAGEWLTRIHGDMVAVINQRTVRWALLSATEVERRLLGATARG